jgi:hypothetical protein
MILVGRSLDEPIRAAHQKGAGVSRRSGEGYYRCPEILALPAYAYLTHFATSAKLGFFPYISIPTR